MANAIGSRGHQDGALLRAAFISGVLALPVAGALLGSSLGVGVAIFLAFPALAMVFIRQAAASPSSLDLANPLVLFGVGWAIFHGLPLPLAMATSGLPGGPRASPGWLAVAGCVAFASILLVAAGFAAARRWRAPALRLPDVTMRLASVLFVIGWGTRLFLIATGSFGYLSHGAEANLGGPVGTIVSSLALVAPMSTAAWGLMVFERKGGPLAKWALAAGVGLSVLTGTVSGLKGQMVTDLIPLAVVYVVVKRRFPWRGVLVLLLLVAFIRPGVQTFREDVSSGRLVGVAGTRAATEVLSRVGSASAATSYGDQVTGLFEHALEAYRIIPDNLALVLQRTGRDLPFLGVRRALLEPLPFVPLSVANGGPFNVSQYVNVSYQEGPPTSSSPAPQPGDLYMSAGWPAVVLGQIAVGVFLGMLWSVVRRGRGTAWLVLYAALGLNFANAGKEFGLLIRGTLQQAVLLALILWGGHRLSGALSRREGVA